MTEWLSTYERKLRQASNETESTKKLSWLNLSQHRGPSFQIILSIHLSTCFAAALQLVSITSFCSYRSITKCFHLDPAASNLPSSPSWHFRLFILVCSLGLVPSEIFEDHIVSQYNKTVCDSSGRQNGKSVTLVFDKIWSADLVVL